MKLRNVIEKPNVCLLLEVFVLVIMISISPGRMIRIKMNEFVHIIMNLQIFTFREYIII